MAASIAACEAVFMRGLLREMGVAMDEPTLLRVDNQGAVALAKDRRSCHRSRHIQRRYLKIREWVALGEVRVEYVNTDENPADLLTKALERESFDRHCATLSGGRPTSRDSRSDCVECACFTPIPPFTLGTFTLLSPSAFLSLSFSACIDARRPSLGPFTESTTATLLGPWACAKVE